MALAFAREGSDVAFSHLDAEKSDADETAGVVEDAGRQAVAVPADVSEPDACRQIVDRAVHRFGRIDVLVNNAAHQMTFDGVESIPAKLLVHTFKTSIIAMFWMCQAALPHMSEGGSVTNVTSTQAHQPSRPLLRHSNTKGAIISCIKGSQKLIEHGILVNAVAPGPVWTSVIPASFRPQKTAGIGRSTPVGRTGQPVKLAPAFVFLASQESSFVNGEILAVTGGRLMS